MNIQTGNQSEVARLLAEIGLNYQAAQRGLSGFAEGTAQHTFITKKMENIEAKRVVLVGIVGEEQAMDLISRVLVDPQPEGKTLVQHEAKEET